MIYRCPLCQQALSKQDKTWCCPANHRFDCAKEGYVNLLPVQKKKSNDPGDNKEMMFARREFLNKGFYQVLSDKVNLLANEYAPDAKCGLDIGCGEGYYSNRLVESLAQDFALYGVDISKSALKYAAKRYPKIAFSVASAFDMPFPDNSFDFMLRIYAPSLDEELKRVVKSGGTLITVCAGPRHHFALKELIYDNPKEHTDAASQIDGFDLVHQERILQQLTLTDEDDISNFLKMTPYNWKLTEQQKLALAKSGFSCELDFKVEVFRAQ
ncbi:23S rRNA (guanine(745)-N(1))-methyltransferase [Shewanella fidelis]|uniref:23S rRNA (Guanine(745)-N(1))-methyltransferase n=1 Tax=Shewanella fidelis TaxID=173509 RepID=A0AAW8NQQ8_9GAMM|nr:23S rRNA (guanine(745)-N(1))-methyltransferase [Shewanella fidelis]MDR8524148.1 23S rRNA (guanine(745)-N(1))-methyltransferase [Shewanella fidelis]MDW4810695.1 23S rRNA (guanine(745)-N(1))-methyltransferase [Shewanella fidelis]MDW4814816.1 23S rRNA (guanine(745)-N(1))-methyltransferase [Shewanella fidelis]MDW4818906.1 23S rRNA (guanine(745)-N(1))-methyltransferase [Shewanella fidelis]MDW4823417.1 23S rRNA (guanine(745)-N(1))-methyltransferase [Shewanella fidelis]